jgi:hypothetical protein
MNAADTSAFPWAAVVSGVVGVAGLAGNLISADLTSRAAETRRLAESGPLVAALVAASNPAAIQARFGSREARTLGPSAEFPKARDVSFNAPKVCECGAFNSESAAFAGRLGNWSRR